MPLKRLLSHPVLYTALQKIVGRRSRSWQIYVNEIIKAQAGMSLLDIGCGPGEVLEFLPDVHYVGVDLESRYIEYAKKRYPERGTFVCCSVEEYELELAGTFDRVLATGLIHHLNDKQAMDLLRIAKKALKPGGILVTHDGCFVENQSPISRWLLKQDRGRFVRTRDEYLKLVRKVFPNLKYVVRHDMLSIPFTVIFMMCENLADSGSELPAYAGAEKVRV